MLRIRFHPDKNNPSLGTLSIVAISIKDTPLFHTLYTRSVDAKNASKTFKLTRHVWPSYEPNGEFLQKNSLGPLFHSSVIIAPESFPPL
jgi:hypothetical protein